MNLAEGGHPAGHATPWVRNHSGPWLKFVREVSGRWTWYLYDEHDQRLGQGGNYASREEAQHARKRVEQLLQPWPGSDYAPGLSFLHPDQNGAFTWELRDAPDQDGKRAYLFIPEPQRTRQQVKDSYRATCEAIYKASLTLYPVGLGPPGAAPE